ncbi:MAG: hypothetical protein WCV72_02645 [Patescibacteria group bacterium]
MHVYKHLKSEQYYIDLYDRHTVEYCRDAEKRFREADVKKHTKKIKTNRSEYEIRGCLTDLSMYFAKGDRYANREGVIREWIDRDREADEKLENTKVPDVRCLHCNEAMECFSKDLQGKWDKKPSLVLFYFRCDNCLVGRAFYSDGTEKDLNQYCEKCSGIMKTKSSLKGRLMITIQTCTKCDHKKKSTYELPKDKDEKKPTVKEIEQFEQDKAEYCLSEKEGKEYLDFQITMKDIARISEEAEHKEKNKKLYNQLDNLKRLNVVDLEKLLLANLEKADYYKLDLGKPEITKYVITEFTIRDGKSGRNQYDSRSQLKKAIEEALIDTNWVLMSGGIDYRMGFLNGKLKGIEDEEELIKLIENRQNKPKNTEKRSSDKPLL